MPKSSNIDFLLFFYCIIAGAVLCIFRDVISAIRKNVKIGGVLSFILDFFFFVIAAILTFLMQFIYSNGQIRWYIWTGELVGYVCSRLTLSLVNAIWMNALIKLIKIILKPIKSFIQRLVSAIITKAENIFNKTHSNSKKCLKNVCDMLYNNINNLQKNKGNKKSQKQKKSKERNDINGGKIKKKCKTKHIA